MTHAPKPLQITQPRSPAIIAPKSLSLGFMYNIRDWLEHDLCPLDFSRLTVLSVGTDTSVFRWPRMLPAHQTIQALEFTSLSSNLFLSMRVYFASKAIATLSTITPASRIQQIGFVVKHPSSDTCAQLDSSVADLPLEHPPSLGLEMDVGTYGVWAPYFPRLKSQNRVCCLPTSFVPPVSLVTSCAAMILIGSRTVSGCSSPAGVLSTSRGPSRAMPSL
ncbi:hypothetical protein B0H14DRAFT_2831893 [Mycena olivaceomarginata]|nr:hypothetical protein B0H14DRAFT_2831893 [Mycena olivaceomarginata]